MPPSPWQATVRRRDTWRSAGVPEGPPPTPPPRRRCRGREQESLEVANKILDEVLVTDRCEPRLALLRQAASAGRLHAFPSPSESEDRESGIAGTLVFTHFSSSPSFASSPMRFSRIA